VDLIRLHKNESQIKTAKPAHIRRILLNMMGKLVHLRSYGQGGETTLR